MKKIILVLCLFVLVGCSGNYIPATEEIPTQTEYRILWVGNSHSRTGDLPRQFSEIVMMHGVIVRFSTIFQDGTTLSDLADRVFLQLQENQYDYVILQDWGSRCCSDAEDFLYDIRRLSAAAHDAGTIPVLFNPPFKYQDDWPNMDYQRAMTAGHENAAALYDALFVDVAMAWAYAKEKHPELDLWQYGGHHASRRGSFFTASVFASTLFNIHVTEVSIVAVYSSDYVEKLGLAAWEFVTQP
ncbi:MAG: SGNH/GDSL hydrolase family protein [Defluviitaleaceae bacterium]|nr:SGNH/GDSL hydrolase family protein [Defluviitaleaceae bacterium]